jgi:uncharacterized protein YdaT
MLLSGNSAVTRVIEMSTKRNQHVVPHEGAWAVRGEGAKRVTETFDRKADAEHRAREIAQNQKSELFVHGKDGKIQSRDSHGNDPFPPKG